MTTILRLPYPSISKLLLLLPIFLSACQTIEEKKSDGSDARQIYDMQADGERQLTAALHQARNENKHVLLSLGANWCSDSQNTFNVLHRDPNLQRMLSDNFVLTLVDANNRVGFQRNPTIIERYNVDLKRGIPVLLVLASDGTPLSTDPNQLPLDSDHKSPEKLVRYLNNWELP